MKKRILLVACFVLLLCFKTVNAKCNNGAIIEQAKNVKIDFFGGMAIDDDDIMYVKLRVYDLTDDMFVLVKNNTTGETKKFKEIENGYVYINTPSPVEQYNYDVKIYSNSQECENELIRSENINSKLFNQFYLSTTCEDLRAIFDKDGINVASKFKGCNYFSDVIYTDDRFKQEYNEFIKQYENQNSKGSIFKKIYRYRYYILFPVLLIGLYYGIRICLINRKEKKENE